MTRPLRLILLLLALLPAAIADAQSSPAKVMVSAAFEPAAPTQGASAELVVHVNVPPGYHAQSDKPLTKNLRPFAVKPVQAAGVAFGTPVYPQAQLELYPVIGQQSVYNGDVRIRLPVTLSSDASVSVISVDVQYQVCNSQGQCFVPETNRVTVNLADNTMAVAPPSTAPNGAALVPSQPTLTEPPASASAGTTPLVVAPAQSVFSALLTAILAGLIFNVMPCVLPVLPLKAVGFYEVANHHRGKSVALGLVFALGVVSVFTLLGIAVFPLTWIKWGELFAHPWFIWPIVALLVVMGLGLLGVFEFALPEGTYRFTPRHDTYGGNFLWGGFTAVLATPCTAPLLPPLLLWAAQQPSAIAVLCMVFVGIGMALPYVILSAMPEVARKLPRSGPWAALFKQMLGFLVIAAATYFGAGRLLHAPYFYVPVFVVIVIASGYLIGRTLLLAPRVRPLMISSAIALLLVGSTGYWTWLMVQSAGHWSTYTKSDFDATRQNQIVLVKFTANWCQTCQWIEGNVYTQGDVWRALNDRNVHAIKADLTDLTDDPQLDPRPLLTQLNPAGGIPLTAIFAPGRREPIVLSSLYSEQDLLAALRSLDSRVAAK